MNLDELRQRYKPVVLEWISRRRASEAASKAAVFEDVPAEMPTRERVG